MHASLLRFLPGALLVVCVLALVCVEVLAAPAPFVKADRSGRRVEPPEQRWLGHWECRHYQGWTMQFVAGGEYRAIDRHGGVPYEGTWRIVPGGIVIMERRVDSCGPWLRIEAMWSEFRRVP